MTGQPVPIQNAPSDTEMVEFDKTPVFTFKVPVETVVAPVWRFAPVSSNVPAPSLVRDPVVLVDAPAIVSMVAALLTSILDVVPAVKVKFRLVEAVAPVYCKVPPLNTILSAALVACPKFPATPPFPIDATLNIPALTVVVPV